MKLTRAEIGRVRVSQDNNGIYIYDPFDRQSFIMFKREEIAKLVFCLAAIGFPVAMLDETPDDT